MKKTILFQGDSITDFGRSRSVKEPNRDLGTGYVNLIASRLTCDNPEISVYNRGVSGNRIVDMYARWEEDT
ncbi:MAG: lysophospholipase, partial [Clostridia bacterium]|nr:lysophospholipase [Clostridia bacterium]